MTVDMVFPFDRDAARVKIVGAPRWGVPDIDEVAARVRTSRPSPGRSSGTFTKLINVADYVKAR
jgi:hypothetical protein